MFINLFDSINQGGSADLAVSKPFLPSHLALFFSESACILFLAQAVPHVNFGWDCLLAVCVCLDRTSVV